MIGPMQFCISRGLPTLSFFVFCTNFSVNSAATSLCTMIRSTDMQI